MDNVINKIVLGEKNNIKVTMTEIASYNMYIVMNNVLLMYIVFKKKMCFIFNSMQPIPCMYRRATYPRNRSVCTVAHNGWIVQPMENS